MRRAAHAECGPMAARLTLRRGTNLLGFENVLTRMFHCASVSVPFRTPAHHIAMLYGGRGRQAGRRAVPNLNKGWIVLKTAELD